jgi:hypothetical protein
MRDEMDARIWVEHGAEFSEGLHSFFLRVGAAIRDMMERLHRYNFDAPWKHEGFSGPGQA